MGTSKCCARPGVRKEEECSQRSAIGRPPRFRTARGILSGQADRHRKRSQVQIALRKWDLNPVLAKHPKDGEQQITLQSSRRLNLFDGENAQLEVQGTLPESDKNHVGSWIRKDVGMTARHLQQQFP